MGDITFSLNKYEFNEVTEFVETEMQILTRSVIPYTSKIWSQMNFETCATYYRLHESNEWTLDCILIVIKIMGNLSYLNKQKLDKY